MKSIRTFTSGEFRDQRKRLRKNLTEPERMLWKNLRGNRNKFRFRRQHSIGPYIADFFCPKLKLVVEIDGKHHAKQDQKLYDVDRTKYFEALDIKVLRFWNSEVVTDLSKVIAKIRNYSALLLEEEKVVADRMRRK